MKRHSVLVIDDSLTIRGIFESILENDGHWDLIGPASNIDEARGFIAKYRPNVITLDLAMPGINGFAFLDELREKEHPPVVVISSSTSQGSADAQEAELRGAVACFDKARLVADAQKLLRALHRIAERATPKS